MTEEEYILKWMEKVCCIRDNDSIGWRPMQALDLGESSLTDLSSVTADTMSPARQVVGRQYETTMTEEEYMLKWVEKVCCIRHIDSSG